jgi:hypothetical protein
MAGCDPTGYGGVVRGFGDRRNIELPVEAGFTPVEAIRIATLNGAIFLGKDTVWSTMNHGSGLTLSSSKEWTAPEASLLASPARPAGVADEGLVAFRQIPDGRHQNRRNENGCDQQCRSYRCSKRNRQSG